MARKSKSGNFVIAGDRVRLLLDHYEDGRALARAGEEGEVTAHKESEGRPLALAVVRLKSGKVVAMRHNALQRIG